MMKLIKINALWCPSCIIMNKIYNNVAEELSLNLISYDYDFDDEVKEYNVGNVLPVLIIEKDNQEVSRIIGEKNHDEIIDIIKEFI